MSIRIDNDRLAGAGSAQAGKAEQAGPVGSRSSYGSGAQRSGGDSVEMSSIAEMLMHAASTQDASRAGRISQLAAAYAVGTYQPDSNNVSRALVDHAISASAGGGIE